MGYHVVTAAEGDPFFERQQQVFAELRRRGIGLVEVVFSGGNDDGSCDAFETYDRSDEYRARLPDLLEHIDAELTAALEEPLNHCDDLSFNGDVSIHGTIYWNVADETVEISYTEEYHDEDEGEDDELED